MPKIVTERQYKIRRFAREYVRDFNGTRAAAAAGYSAARAATTASELLDDPECQAEIERALVRPRSLRECYRRGVVLR